MHKSHLLTICTGLSLFLCGTSQAALILHWALDETSGTVASDSSGNGITGAWQGTVGTPAWVPAGGIDGGAFSFTGANRDSFITSSFSAIAGDPSTPFTLSAWVKTTSTENDGLVYLGDGATGDRYYVLRMQANLARANARNTSEIQGAGTTAINDGAWHHVVAVYGGTTDRKIYVDGVLEGTSTTNVNAFALSRFGIGALTRNTPYNPADLYTGLMDEVQLYDTALTAGEISFLAANPGAVVPEAGTLSLLGLVAAGGCLRRRRQV